MSLDRWFKNLLFLIFIKIAKQKFSIKKETTNAVSFFVHEVTFYPA